MTETDINENNNNNLNGIPTIIYALQAVGFIIFVTWIVAIIMGYIKRSEYKGTWVESHIKWQINTFWGGVLGNILGLILMNFGGVGLLISIPTFFWAIYRVAKGWMSLIEEKEMYI